MSVRQYVTLLHEDDTSFRKEMAMKKLF